MLSLNKSKLLKSAITIVMTIVFALSMFLGINIQNAIAGEGDVKKEVNGTHYLFCYVKDKDGKDILLRAMPKEEFKQLGNGETSYFSYVDKFPTTCYSESTGFTIPELFSQIINTTTVQNATDLTFIGNDEVDFKSSDSMNGYMDTFSYDFLYGIDRYFFPDMFDLWSSTWRTNNGNEDKNYLTNKDDAKYKDLGKDEAWENREKMEPILAYKGFSGRVKDHQSYIDENGGVVKGCFKDVADGLKSLRLCIPTSEQQMRTGESSAFKYRYLVCSIRFKPENSTVASLGTIEESKPIFTRDGDILKITFMQPEDGSDIYYDIEEEYNNPQKLYAGETIEVNIANRNLNTKPVRVKSLTVKEGYADKGDQTYEYNGKNSVSIGKVTKAEGDNESNIQITEPSNTKAVDAGAVVKFKVTIKDKMQLKNGSLKAVYYDGNQEKTCALTALGNDTYSFVMPNTNVSINAAFGNQASVSVASISAVDKLYMSDTNNELSYVVSLGNVENANMVDVIAQFDKNNLEYMNYEFVLPEGSPKIAVVGEPYDATTGKFHLKSIVNEKGGSGKYYTSAESTPFVKINFKLKDNIPTGTSISGSLNQVEIAAIITEGGEESSVVGNANLINHKANTEIIEAALKYNIDGNDVFDKRDISLIVANYYLHTTQDATWDEAKLYDVNEDGKIDIIDITSFFSYLN